MDVPSSLDADGVRDDEETFVDADCKTIVFITVGPVTYMVDVDSLLEVEEPDDAAEGDEVDIEPPRPRRIYGPTP